MFVRPRAARWAAVAVVVAGAAGCGGDPPVGQVSGKVTQKGQPVGSADLVFQPVANPDAQFPGHSREEGAYLVTYRGAAGLPVGRYKVTVTRYWLPGGKALGEGEAAGIAKSEGRATAEAYTFERDVAAGPNTFDFELSEGTKIDVPPPAPPGS